MAGNPMYVQGEVAAEQTGKTVAEIDAAAATGEIPSHYVGLATAGLRR